MIQCPVCGKKTQAEGGRCMYCSTIVATGDPAHDPTELPASSPEPPTVIPTPTIGPTPTEVRDSGPPVGTGRDKGLFEPGQSFGRRYRIIRVLGVGGMGAVYQAWDEELRIPVALKVIRSTEADDPHVVKELEERFKREILLARQVTPQERRSNL